MAEPAVDSISASSPQHLVVSTYIKPQARKPYDPSVTFEEYHFYAKRTREEEKLIEAPKTNWKELLLRKKAETEIEVNEPSTLQVHNEKLAHRAARIEISDEEWTNASRAFRTASAGACK